MLERPSLPRVEEDLASRRRLYVLALILLAVGELLSALDVVNGSHVEFAAFAHGGNALFVISLVAGFVVFLATGPSRLELTAVLTLGALLEATQMGWRVWNHQPGASLVMNAGGGFGIAGILVGIGAALRASGEARRRALWRLSAIALFPTFMFLSRIFVDLTQTLDPLVSDTAAYAADSCLGFAPAFAIARLVHHPPFAWLSYFFTTVYFGIPLAAAVLQIQQLRHPDRSRDDIGLAIIFAGVIGGVLYNVVPVAGPAYVFGRMFPSAPPDASYLPLPSVLGPMASRNGIPSMHTTWVLLMLWQSRPHPRWVRVFTATFVVLTLLATMAIGEHYLVDLVVSVPFAVAIEAALASTVAWSAWQRWAPVLVGAGYFALWSVLFLAAPGFFLRQPELTAGLFVFTVLPPLLLHRELGRARSDAPAELSPATPTDGTATPTRVSTRVRTAVAAMFFASGFAGLIYEVTFAKSLALVFGSTATAATTVLATYMGGMSLGSWLGGRLAARTRQPLRLYALCEGGVALTCAASGLLFGALRAPYVALAHGIDPGHPSLVVIQVLLGAALLLPPTLLMGMTLPVLTRQLQADDASLGDSVGSLYGMNTLGAATGALAAGYFLLQWLGVMRTTLTAVVLNLIIALVALRWAQRDVGTATAERIPEAATAQAPLSRQGWLGLAVLTVGGFVTLALEGLDTHLLAVVAGNSVFAFAAMLCCFLLGLGAGSSLGRAWLRRGLSPVVGVGIAQALVATAVLVGVFGWNRIPDYFASFATYPHARSFASREVVRFLVCALEMVPPATFIGASFPLAMECVGQGRSDGASAVGRAVALNTLGNIVGALVGGFVLMPLFGSLRALQVLAATSLALSVAALAAATARQRRWVGGAVAVGALTLAIQPGTFDLTRLASGANVYFEPQQYGYVIDHSESAAGGLTTVVQMQREGKTIKTLETNGKFQGDDNAQIPAQVAFALFPLLHTTQRGSALVIGFGTGMSARVVTDAGFHDVDVAELSADIAHMSEKHFASVNDHVLERPNVHLHVTDGRNYLLVEPKQYDLVAMEISSIWFAGAASLYSTDFYNLVASRLSARGVLQQWVQLHHLSEWDEISILASLRSVFPKVWLYEAGEQGILVACASECEPTELAIAQLDGQPELQGALGILGGSASTLLGRRVLTPDSVDRLLAKTQASVGALDDVASTDDNLRLDYSTPRGNVRNYKQSWTANMQLLSAFRPPSPLAGTRIDWNGQ